MTSSSVCKERNAHLTRNLSAAFKVKLDVAVFMPLGGECPLSPLRAMHVCFAAVLGLAPYRPRIKLCCFQNQAVNFAGVAGDINCAAAPGCHQGERERIKLELLCTCCPVPEGNACALRCKAEHATRASRGARSSGTQRAMANPSLPWRSSVLVNGWCPESLPAPKV